VGFLVDRVTLGKFFHLSLSIRLSLLLRACDRCLVLGASYLTRPFWLDKRLFWYFISKWPRKLYRKFQFSRNFGILFAIACKFNYLYAISKPTALLRFTVAKLRTICSHNEHGLTHDSPQPHLRISKHTAPSHIWNNMTCRRTYL
jgi:hypothetical protein